MIDSYVTILNRSSGEFTVQKSRFIGYACPCKSEEDALRFIREIREKHRDAKHHCYAYIIGKNSGIMRYSDDGEPGGTAGMPIMDVLKNSNIVDGCVVVVRYFGGVLLGTGGLVRAYTQGCKAALEAASVVTMVRSVSIRCRVSYSVWNQLQFLLQKLHVQTQNVNYQQDVEFKICVRSSDLAEVMDSITNIADGKAEWSSPEEQFVPWSS